MFVTTCTQSWQRSNQVITWLMPEWEIIGLVLKMSLLKKFTSSPGNCYPKVKPFYFINNSNRTSLKTILISTRGGLYRKLLAHFTTHPVVATVRENSLVLLKLLNRSNASLVFITQCSDIVYWLDSLWRRFYVLYIFLEPQALKRHRYNPKSILYICSLPRARQKFRWYLVPRRF